MYSIRPEGFGMNAPEYEERLKALQQEVSKAYLAGYSEARQRAQWTITGALDEAARLRLALESALDEIHDETTRTRILAAMHRSRSPDQLGSEP
jgi:acyl-homoserine lactone acylase PvdQ